LKKIASLVSKLITRHRQLKKLRAETLQSLKEARDEYGCES
jgi:hypothetical protein